ncbi:MAG: hypothetical protein JNN10_12565 [Sphingopyxis sp.]|uniref:DUF6118 family protein n=1 Tax=Sphingopyxis sp. TaxID=1908224 RepID=UPI001A586690|nr:DUF6118 family protein [Sphingopyxis sp.]MBL9067118.1 hypothetical protein [Sphingopyxis sp.]
MTQKPVRTPPATDAAKAFEELRREISLQRTAIEGLTAAKEKLPDYLPTLRDIASRLGEMEKQIESINAKPAMRLTPQTITVEIREAIMSYRADDAKSIGEARDTLARMLGRVEGMIKQRRSSAEQDLWVTWAATGGLLFGALLVLVGVATWS